MDIIKWHNWNESSPLKEGDYVKIREDLRSSTRYGVNSTNGCMPYFAGITTQIELVARDSDGDEQYRLQADGMTWYWTREMLDRGHPNDAKANKKIIVGDAVTIRDDLEAGRMYGEQMFTYDMEKYMGQTMEVLDIAADDMHAQFILEEPDGFWWTPEMLIKRG